MNELRVASQLRVPSCEGCFACALLPSELATRNSQLGNRQPATGNWQLATYER